MYNKLLKSTSSQEEDSYSLLRLLLLDYRFFDLMQRLLESVDIGVVVLEGKPPLSLRCLSMAAKERGGFGFDNLGASCSSNHPSTFCKSSTPSFKETFSNNDTFEVVVDNDFAKMSSLCLDCINLSLPL